jgi:molybdopterin converting factor small subunit
MRIKIKYLGLIRRKTGKKEELRKMKKGSLLSDLLCDLSKVYGETFNNILTVDEKAHLDPTFIITVNGFLKDLNESDNVVLNDGDTVSLMTLISGG